MDPNSEGNYNTDRLCYSREFLLKYDRYILDPEISTLVNQLNNNWPRVTPKKVNNRTPVDTPIVDPKSPTRYSKGYPKKKPPNTINGKCEVKNGSRNIPVKPLRLIPPPGLSKSEPIPNDGLFKANSFPSALHFSSQPAIFFGDETPKKIPSSPVFSYAEMFQTTLQYPNDPSLNFYGESKFMSLFSQPAPPIEDIEINLKPYLSLDFIEDPPQPCPPKTPTSKPLLSPRNQDISDKSPYRNSKTPQKSPRNRPVSPLDDQRLIQRQKQIDYGYRTVGYLRYRLLVPKEARKPEHPRTPKKAQGCSKRSWDGQLKKWRRDLHLWDPDNLEAFRALLNSDVVENFVAQYPELEEVVRAVREKLDNPNIKINEEDEDSDDDSNNIVRDYSHQKKPNTVRFGEENQVISEPNKQKVARTLIFN